MSANFSEELIKLYNSKYKYLFETTKKKHTTTSEERLIDLFIEIQDFFEKNNKIPNIDSDDKDEAILGKRLLILKSNKSNSELLAPFDRFELLKDNPAPKSIKELLESENTIFSKDNMQIFNVRSIFKKSQTGDFEKKAERTVCKDFEKFKPLFNDIQLKLKNGEKNLRYFTNINQLVEKGFYVYEGMMLYVEEFGKFVKINSHTQQRLRVIFENGFESNMYKRSLAQRLYEGGFVVVNSINNSNFEAPEITENIVGYIYVLKSKSTNESITTIKDLYKIGFTRTTVSERVKNAADDPTYLMSDVEIVASYTVTGDYNPQKIENLIHRVFADAALDLSIIDFNGKEVKPKEWYSVPLHVIEQAVNMINSREIVDYYYDKETKRMKPIKSL